MTIECRGDDPAGLYLAILLKERDPARTVRIRTNRRAMSRSLPSITETPIRPCFALRDAELNAEIARLMARFTGIEIVTKNRTVRSEQPYAVLPTDALLQVL